MSRGVFATLLFWATVAASCRCRDEASESAPPTLDERACASACAALVSAGCDAAGLDPADQPRCVAACAARTAELAPAGCDVQRRTYLACVATARVDCSAVRCSPAVCLEHATGINGCDATHQAYGACIAPCLHVGVTHTGDKRVPVQGSERRVQAELVRTGCVPAPALLRKGAVAGSACQSPTVCEERFCRCPAAKATYAARACIDGRCAAAGDVCLAARAASPVDPC